MSSSEGGIKTFLRKMFIFLVSVIILRGLLYFLGFNRRIPVLDEGIEFFYDLVMRLAQIFVPLVQRIPSL